MSGEGSSAFLYASFRMDPNTAYSLLTPNVVALLSLGNYETLYVLGLGAW